MLYKRRHSTQRLGFLPKSNNCQEVGPGSQAFQNWLLSHSPPQRSSARYAFCCQPIACRRHSKQGALEVRAGLHPQPPCTCCSARNRERGQPLSAELLMSGAGEMGAGTDLWPPVDRSS